MNNALRYAGAVFALDLLLAGLMALLHRLTGERSESFAIPGLLMALGLGSGALVWHLPGFGGSGDCDAEDFSNSGEMRDGGSETA